MRLETLHAPAPTPVSGAECLLKHRANCFLTRLTRREASWLVGHGPTPLHGASHGHSGTAHRIVLTWATYRILTTRPQGGGHLVEARRPLVAACPLRIELAAIAAMSFQESWALIGAKTETVAEL